MRNRIARLLYRVAMKVDPSEPLSWHTRLHDARDFRAVYADLDLDNWDRVTIRKIKP